jgi:hypothetical protein
MIKNFAPLPLSNHMQAEKKKSRKKNKSRGKRQKGKRNLEESF